jgi:hypothetical protein
MYEKWTVNILIYKELPILEIHMLIVHIIRTRIQFVKGLINF